MKIEGEVDARKVAQAHKSPEYRRIEELEAWVDCEQYQGRKSWWDDSCPQWERAPCIVYPIARMAIEANVDMMLGERAFPRFVVEHDEEEDGEEDDETPNPSDGISGLIRASRFRTFAREGFADAQKAGTAVGVFGVRNGRPFADLIPAKWCTPTFKSPGSFEVQSVEIQYPYIVHEQKSDGTYEAVCYMYRRVIGEQADTVFKPAKLIDDQPKKINWTRDASQTVKHGFGFCPVVWYPFMRGCQAVNVIHGRAIHEGHTDEIFAHDLSRSQWHKVALYSEPQPYEIGVNDGYNPTESGREARVLATEHGGEVHPTENPVTASYGSPSQTARRKGSGYVWQYPNKDTTVGYLTVPAAAIEALQGNTLDLRQRLQEALGVVFLDPENIKFASVTSGKGLKALKQRHEDRVEQYREDFRDGFMLPALAMLIRVVKAKGLDFPGAETLAALDDSMIEHRILVRWGSYSAPDFTEQAQIVSLVNEATPLVGREVAIRKLQEADVFEIEDASDVEDDDENADAMLKASELLSEIDLSAIPSDTFRAEFLGRLLTALLPDADDAMKNAIRQELEKGLAEAQKMKEKLHDAPVPPRPGQPQQPAVPPVTEDADQE